MDLLNYRCRLVVVAVAVFLCLSIATTAQAQSDNNDRVEKYIKAEGWIRSIENKPTTWMYGTHVLVRDNEIRFALKSDTLDLNRYVGENTFITGEVIHEGVDGGPTYLNVMKIGSYSDDEENEKDYQSNGVYDDFYLARTNSISVEVALNKPGLGYNLEPLENMRNVEQLSETAYLYRSHAMENLAVTVYEGELIPKEKRFLSVRLTPAYEKVSKVTGYSGEISFQEAPTVKNLRALDWEVSGDPAFKAMYENKAFSLSIGAKRKGRGTLWVNFKIIEISEDLKSKVFSFIGKSLKMEQSTVREKLIPLNKETSTEIEPLVNFTDKKAGEALKTELKWLENNGIISGLSEEDLVAIGQVAKVGYAGVNSRVFYARWNYPSPEEDFDVKPREKPKWMSYFNADYPRVGWRGGLEKIQEKKVIIPDQTPQQSLQALIKDLRSELSQTKGQLETLRTELSEAREAAEDTVSIWMYGASMGVTIVAALGAVYLFKRKRGQEDNLPLSSFLLEQGLDDMTIKDAEIFRKVLEAERFTVPEIAEGAPVSRNSVRRLVNKLEENGLIEQIGEKKSPAGRGKPRKAYRLTENIESRGKGAV